MVDHNTTVTEDELHVYVDGELPADRRERRRGLACKPSGGCRPRRRLARAGRGHPRALWRVINEPVPDRLDAQADHAAAGAPGARSRRRPRWRRSSSAAPPAGWRAALRRRRRTRSRPFTADALDAHKLYISEVRHPIEVKADEDHLLPWLSKRVGTTLRAPDLGAVRPQAPGRPAAARRRRAGGAVHVRGRERRALHDLLLAARRGADGVPLRRQRRLRRGALDRRQLRLGGQRPEGQGPAEGRSRAPPTIRSRTARPRPRRARPTQLMSRRGS